MAGVMRLSCGVQHIKTWNNSMRIFYINPHIDWARKKISRNRKSVFLAHFLDRCSFGSNGKSNCIRHLKIAQCAVRLTLKTLLASARCSGQYPKSASGDASHNFSTDCSLHNLYLLDMQSSTAALGASGVVELLRHLPSVVDARQQQFRMAAVARCDADRADADQPLQGALLE